jgi:hypothetical protein
MFFGDKINKKKAVDSLFWPNSKPTAGVLLIG